MKKENKIGLFGIFELDFAHSILEKHGKRGCGLVCILAMAKYLRVNPADLQTALITFSKIAHQNRKSGK